MLLRVFERNFLVRIGDRIHHLLHAENLDRSGAFIQFRHQLFVGVEMLARRHQHGVLHRVPNDLRIDPFLLAQDFDGLINVPRLVMSVRCSVFGGLPLELEIGFLHLFERELDALARSGFECDDSFGETPAARRPSGV